MEDHRRKRQPLLSSVAHQYEKADCQNHVAGNRQRQSITSPTDDRARASQAADTAEFHGVGHQWDTGCLLHFHASCYIDCTAYQRLHRIPADIAR